MYVWYIYQQKRITIDIKPHSDSSSVKTTSKSNTYEENTSLSTNIRRLRESTHMKQRETIELSSMRAEEHSICKTIQVDVKRNDWN